jgi:hypothetical protein
MHATNLASNFHSPIAVVICGIGTRTLDKGGSFLST